VADKQACSINMNPGVRFTWKYFRISQHTSEASYNRQVRQPPFQPLERLTITLHEAENDVRFFRFDRYLISDLRTLPMAERPSDNYNPQV
jgi:hypothetical protein